MAKNLSSAAQGHNSDGAIDAEALRRYVVPARNLMAQQKEIGDALKEVCAEADEAGAASKKEIRRLARMSLMDQDILEAQREREDMLLRALGDLSSLPLGEAALKRSKAPKRGPGRPRKNPAEDALGKAIRHLDGDDFGAPSGNA